MIYDNIFFEIKYISRNNHNKLLLGILKLYKYNNINRSLLSKK